MKTDFPPRGLYAITPERPRPPLSLPEQVAQALQGGARLVQYRDKSQDRAKRLAEARALADLCQRQGVPLLINDDVELAQVVGAAGVHLGRDDLDLAEARARLGPDALIGVSCYDQLALAERAQSQGADYVAFGRFFPSVTKPGAVPASLDLLRQARARVRLPLVAIGGITPQNGGPLIGAGAHLLAVIEALFGQPDIPGACRAFANLFHNPQG